MIIEENIKLDFQDVLLRPKRSEIYSRENIDLNRRFKFLHSGKVLNCIPVVASNMDTVGTIKMAETLSKQKILTCLSKHLSSTKIPNSDFVSLSCGIREKDYEKINYITKENHIPILTIDVANGYSQKLIKFVERIRTICPDTILIAGNVVTPEMTEAIILSGADVVKVGLGSGAACLTRRMAGVGYPQLSSVIECSDAAHGLGGHIMSDGGCVVPGDLAKAFSAGADFVMLGSMFAGHDENGGDLIEINGKQYKEFYGMASRTAMNSYNNGVKVYRTVEGKKTLIPHKGSVENTVNEILGGLRSSCSYIGAISIKDMPKCATFIKVSRQLNESLNNFEIEDNKKIKEENNKNHFINHLDKVEKLTKDWPDWKKHLLGRKANKHTI